ncbi:MAG: UxaA family hydrolase, partial [Anaerolineae bacterium]
MEKDIVHVLLMHPDDNVVVAAADLSAGQTVAMAGEAIPVAQPIPFGHKLARRAIGRGAIVVKYGQPIGRAVADIAPGEHVHVHNM